MIGELGGSAKSDGLSSAVSPEDNSGSGAGDGDNSASGSGSGEGRIGMNDGGLGGGGMIGVCER